MARPKMKFTPEEAAELIFYIRGRLEDWEFCVSHIISEGAQGSPSHAAKTEFEPFSQLASAAFRDKRPLTEEHCVQLRDWLSKWISPQGWTRIQAARRQKALANRQRRQDYRAQTTSVDTSSMTAYYLLSMAEKVGIDRKAYIGHLVDYLVLSPKGEQAREEFEKELKKRLSLESRELLTKTFSVSTDELNIAVAELNRNLSESFDEVLQATQTLGPAKLTKLAAWAKRKDPANPLTRALSPCDEFAGSSPLVGMSKGMALPALRKPRGSQKLF